MNAVVEELKKLDNVELTEFFLPKDMPHFCVGCYSCFMRGENACPHADSVQLIAKEITACDLVILTSPIYAFDVSGAMKALLDHLCYMWMSHRPDARMFHKIGLTVATTAGMGLKHTTKTLTDSLKFWGVKKVFSMKTPVAAMKWDDIKAEKRAQIERRAKKLAQKIARAVEREPRIRFPLFRGFMFRMMAGMQKKNDWNQTDRNHWASQGWLEGGKPF
jgi:multimeric flavodoxin WrbA